MPARRLIVAMPKGGSGKTATTVAFAWALQRAGRKVLVVDLDPQGNATGALGVAENHSYGVLEFLLRPQISFAPRSTAEGIDVIPASPWKAGPDLEIQSANRLTGPVAVREALQRVEDSYDYVTCDCAPGLGPLTYNALAAGPILVPVEMTRLAVSVIPDLDQVVSRLRRAVAPASVLAYLATRYVEAQTESREAFAALNRLRRGQVLSARIPVATAIARAMAEAESPFSPRFRHSKGPKAYLAAVDEVVQLLESDHE